MEDVSTAHETEVDTNQAREGSRQGPSTHLIAYIYPLDGVEHESGWRAFEAPIARKYWRELGSCLIDEGYTAVGQAMLVARPAYPSEIWRFPQLRRFRDVGFVFEDYSEVLNLSGWIGASLHSAEDPFVEYIENTPEFEIVPTVSAINDFQEAYLERCISNIENPAAFGGAMELWLRWYELVDEIFGHPDLQGSIQDLFGCLERNVNGGRPIEDQEDAVAAIDAVLFSDDDEILLRRGQEYATCMEPFIEARRPILAAERERLVQEKFGTLLAMEELFDSLLAE